MQGGMRPLSHPFPRERPMSTSAQDILQRHRLSVDEYHRMASTGILPEDSRVELINGEIIDMAPIGSRHAAAVKQLTRILSRAVGDTAIVSVQDPIHLDPHTEPQPDLALLRPREDFYRTAHPRADDVLLIIEVADASLRYEREIKIPLYARHGIPEVWLVDLLDNRLQRFRDGTSEGYREESQAVALEGLSPLRLHEAALDLRGLW